MLCVSWRVRRLLVAIALALALSINTPAATLAVSTTWTGASSTNWSDAGNWNPSVPANGDAVTLANSGLAPLNYDLNVTLASITTNYGNVPITNSGGGSLGLQSGGFITMNAAGGGGLHTGLTLNGPATLTEASGAGLWDFNVSAITGTGGLTLTNNSSNDNLDLRVVNTYRWRPPSAVKTAA